MKDDKEPHFFVLFSSHEHCCRSLLAGNMGFFRGILWTGAMSQVAMFGFVMMSVIYASTEGSGNGGGGGQG